MALQRDAREDRADFNKRRGFKDYDKLFSKHRGELVLKPTEVAVADKILRWDLHVVVPPQGLVQYWVYEAPDFLEWQVFRVGLKGLPTKHKLYRLNELWENSLGERSTLQAGMSIRIDNYIGALVRGGLLSNDGKYTVLK
jgi:hypothetical protein